MTRKYERSEPENMRNKGETCAGPECDRPAVVKGLCHTHYGQIRRGKKLYPIKWTRPDVKEYTKKK